MSAEAPEHPDSIEEPGRRGPTLEAWQVGIVGLGIVLLLAHPLIGTKLPFPSGGLIAGLLLPVLCFAVALLPLGRKASRGSRVAARRAEEPAPDRTRMAEWSSARRRGWMRSATYVAVPLVALACLILVSLFAAVVCFVAGAAVLALLPGTDPD